MKQFIKQFKDMDVFQQTAMVLWVLLIIMVLCSWCICCCPAYSNT